MTHQQTGRRKLTHSKVPAEHFDFARSRTADLIDHIGFYYRRSRHIAPGDALGDILACAYLQGCNDTTQAIANNPSLIDAERRS